MDKKFFSERYEALGGRIEQVHPQRAIRLNTLIAPASDTLRALNSKEVKLEKIPFLRNGYYTESHFSLGAAPEYLLGQYQLQEGASQLPAEALAPTEKDTVLDMCAAPGAKTTQLAQLMNNKGLIVAIDLKKERIPSLCNNLERMGVTNTIVYQMNALEVSKLNIKFTKILLDAPCSGNYVGEPGWFERRDLDGIKRNAELQRKLLAAAAGVLEEGGTIVYSTCSLEPEEDEEAIRYAVDELGLKIVPIENVPGDSVLEGTKRLWPYKTGTQGFFLAKLKK